VLLYRLVVEGSQGFADPKDAVLGIQRAMPRLRGIWHRTWGAIASWKAKLPRQSRWPQPERVMLGLVLSTLDAALGVPTHAIYYFSAAVLCGLACYGLLRPK
jgi:hypothetical protein